MATTIRSTDLDFNNIKNNLKTYLQRQEQFRDYDFEASGMSNILDVLAHNTHMNALIANFALNESFLPTAQLRSSMVSLAEGIGYIPDTRTASVAYLRIYFNSTTAGRDSTIDLPAFTKFTTTVDDVTYTFQTIQSYSATDDGTGFYEFKTDDGSNRIPVYEGAQKTKTFLVGEYVDNPVYIIPDTTIDVDTASVKVYESSTSVVAVPYQNIINASTLNASSTVYILKEAPNGFYELSFGDGQTFGIAPSAGNRIEVKYLSTKGADANGASSFSPQSTLTAGGVTGATLNITTLTNSVGGDEKESIESIRKNAPFQYATQNRMVTAEDYSSLILRQYSTLIKDIVAWGGQDDLNPEFGSVFTSILFEDDVDLSTQSATKRNIVDLASQLAIISYNIRFTDPVKTYVELDVYFQFNKNLTDETLSSVQDNIEAIVVKYFNTNTGKFKQAFRRSNLLTLIDEYSGAVLSSRADVRLQQRFTPSSPNLIATINNLTLNTLSEDQINYVVELTTKGKYGIAASYLVNNDYSVSNYTVTRSALASTSINNLQQLRYPVSLAVPDDDTYIVTSNVFTYNGYQAYIRNALSSTTLQIVDTAGTTVLNNNIGNYVPGTGVVSIQYFTPSSISGGDTQLKLSCIPANQSAVAPGRNELLEYDSTRSKITGVNVTATN